jgi:DNA-binding ferritin-like protein
MEDWEKQRKEWIKYLESPSYYGDATKANQNLIGISAEAYNVSKSNFDLNDLARLKILSDEEFDKIGEEYYKNKKVFLKEISEQLITKMIEYSGIKKLEKIIQDNFIKEYRTSLLKDFEEEYQILNKQIINFAKRHKQLIELNIENTTKSKEELEKGIAEGKENLLRMRKRMEELDENVKDVKESFNNEFEELKNGFDELKAEIRKIRID